MSYHRELSVKWGTGLKMQKQVVQCLQWVAVHVCECETGLSHANLLHRHIGATWMYFLTPYKRTYAICVFVTTSHSMTFSTDILGPHRQWGPSRFATSTSGPLHRGDWNKSEREGMALQPAYSSMYPRSLNSQLSIKGHRWIAQDKTKLYSLWFAIRVRVLSVCG